MAHSKFTVTLFTNQHKSLTETHTHIHTYTGRGRAEHDLYRTQLVTCSYFNAASDCLRPNDNIKHNYNHCGDGLNCNYKANYVAGTANGTGNGTGIDNGNGAWRQARVRVPSFW